jgi:hypothetical protein
MEHEDSLPCSQERAIGPYPEPYESSPYYLTCLKSILILSPQLRLGLPNGLLPSSFSTETLYAFRSTLIRVENI